ncbi:hypothetical protein NLX83_31425 [Allokutzneria sp. A3M-2-11 16]|uniref:hypothetical protein n=1 Tax=Allokutzneria sp. A3M-2-11 16 TaxID=2962043 RepID=UPI0020B8FA8D|nr:hypothetical protein [Allokutzneria sp. A3M-2-11 16]MCP3803791.1 hypothetical protein [Allokutzneria sp. A3M-2-11 16]
MTTWSRPAALLAASLVATALAVPAIAAPVDPTTDITVGTPQELAKALANAKPGATITLAPGAYEGEFVITAAGSAAAPITLTGPREAVLSNGGGYGLHLNGAAHWRLNGFSVRRSAKGVVLDRSHHVVLDGLHLSTVDEEAVHFRTSSSDNVIRRSTIRDTGRGKPQFGEGIYFGSAKSNWKKFGENGGKGPDRSDRNQALENTIGPGVTAEHVDVKEGTAGGVIRGNSFDGHGISGQNYADSWVDVKGDGYLVEGNRGTFDGSGALVDGYQTHTVVDGTGCGTVFRANDSDLGGAKGWAINVTNQNKCAKPAVVHSDNKVRNAGRGLTNIEVGAP